MQTFVRREQRVQAERFDPLTPLAIDEVRVVQVNDNGDVFGAHPKFDASRAVENPGGLRNAFAIWSDKYGWRVLSHGSWIVRFGTHTEVWSHERFSRAFDLQGSPGVCETHPTRTSKLRLAQLEETVRDLRGALEMCADGEDGWPHTSIADAYEASRKLVPDDEGSTNGGKP